jgi:hypothetical protein
MWTAAVVALVLGLPPAQPGTSLALTKPHFTYGPGGVTRPDAKYLPGDTVFLSFDVANLKFDADANASYRIAMEVTNADGEAVLRQKPHASKVKNILGGKAVPCRVHVALPPGYPSGTYTIKVTVEDLATKQGQSLAQKFEVLPAAFGLVQVGASATNDGMAPVPTVGVEGAPLYLTFAVVGFGRGKDKQLDISASLRVLDEKGKPTTAKPFADRAKREIPEGLQLIPLQFGLTLNRVGSFTLEFTATDHVTGQKARATMPLKVVSAR